jgi:aldehyde dehydrogenase (NAD+)
MDELSKIFTQQSLNRWVISKTSAKKRISKLKLLRLEIIAQRSEITHALFLDLRKPKQESELYEVHSVLTEINYAIKNLEKWMKPKKTSTPIVLFGARSEIRYEARGLVLILSPWNYPFSLLLNPLVAAIAAGNCVIAKASEKTPYTASLLKNIIDKIFQPNEIAIVLGEVSVAEKLLELPFDHIFFTGSAHIG